MIYDDVARHGYSTVSANDGGFANAMMIPEHQKAARQISSDWSNDYLNHLGERLRQRQLINTKL